jgi:thiol-disulfide isomerase/thioredoxin
MKTFTALLLLIFGAPSVFAFSDVDSEHPNAEAIDYVEAEAMVEGYGDGSYAPDAMINRAEFTKIIVEATLGPIDDSDKSLEGLEFFDLEDQAWYNPYIREAVAAGIVSGYEDLSFKPGEDINFAEASKILVEAFDYDYGSSSTWYEPYVEALEERSAIPMSVFNFSSLVTRGEMAEMIYRLHSGLDTKLTATYEMLEGEVQYLDFNQELYEELLGQRAITLYFHADWCPTCVVIEEYLLDHLYSFPAGGIFLAVDYDTETELIDEYGVSTQYTFVILDEDAEIVESYVTNNVAYVRQAMETSLNL